MCPADIVRLNKFDTMISCVFVAVSPALLGQRQATCRLMPKPARGRRWKAAQSLYSDNALQSHARSGAKLPVAVTPDIDCLLFSLDDWIKRPPPILVGIIHHQVDKDRHQEGQDCRAVSDLRSVDPAVPGRPAMDQLIAQDV